MRSTPWIAVLVASVFAGCVTTEDDGGTTPPDEEVTAGPGNGTMAIPAAPGPSPDCATPSVATLTGNASRTQQHYPDNIAADVTWTLVETTGCVDRYAPSGTAHYQFAIPGAQCGQSITPADHVIGSGDGVLTVDRSTSPATFTAHGATTWDITWTCRFDADNAETMEVVGAGGVWLDASGTFEPGFTGELVLEDGSVCGLHYASTECTYAWAFEPLP